MSKNINMDSWVLNQDLHGVSDDFFNDSLRFDDALKLFDFPLEPVEENGVVEDWDTKFESLELPPPDALASLSSTFCAQGQKETKKISVSLPKILEDAASRRSLHQSNSSSSKGSCVLQTSSLVSVLESNSSSSNSAAGHPAPFDPKIIVPVKKRSKRPRSSISKPAWKRSSVSDLFLESNMERILSLVKRKTTRKKPALLSGGKEVKESLSQQSAPVRKCSHCESTRTPQWREGPMGRKTLCNACGVRYRSGRLFPEYRPASSPTFVASLHSNSHRKVTELRKKPANGAVMDGSSSLPLQENLVS